MTTGFSGDVFEPADEYKGDFARTYFYMATRYEDLIAGWTNNTTESQAMPDGCLVRMSDKGFDNIATPVCGTAASNDFWNKNVVYGKQTTTFGDLSPGQIYYFRIFSYKGSGASIDYKTDGNIPETSIQANSTIIYKIHIFKKAQSHENLFLFTNVYLFMRHAAVGQ